MKAGKLRHRVDIQKQTLVSDGAGGSTRTGWTNVDGGEGVWCEVRPVSAREMFMADKHAQQVTHVIRARHSADFDTKHRLKFGSRYFNIVGLRNVEERDRELELICKETTGAPA